MRTEAQKARRKEYFQLNKERINANKRKSPSYARRLAADKEKQKTDPEFRAKNLQRVRLRRERIKAERAAMALAEQLSHEPTADELERMRIEAIEQAEENRCELTPDELERLRAKAQELLRKADYRAKLARYGIQVKEMRMVA